MPTLAELVREGLVVDVVAGRMGLGREVRGVRRVGFDSGGPGVIAPGELAVLESPVNGHAGKDIPVWHRRLTELLEMPAAAVIVDAEPDGVAQQLANLRNRPLLAASDIGEVATRCEKWLATETTTAERLEHRLSDELVDLAQAGGDLAELLQRVVELTGKSGALHTVDGWVAGIALISRTEREADLVRQALLATPAAVGSDLSDATSVLCVPLPELGLVRLTIPFTVGPDAGRSLSLISRPEEVVTRDRAALQAANAAVRRSPALGQSAADTIPSAIARTRTHGALALRPHATTLEALSDALVDERLVHIDTMHLAGGPGYLRLVVPHDKGKDGSDWTTRVQHLHGQLSSRIGSVSIGYAPPRRGSRALRQALVEAGEALAIGHRLFGPGHLTSYGEARVARFLLELPHNADLNALYEGAVGRLKSDRGELVATLETYYACGSSLQRTASALGIHRNTVLYRLRRIEEQGFVNLDDPGTRLLVQLGTAAGRIALRAHRTPASPLARSAWGRTNTTSAMHTIAPSDLLALVPSLEIALSGVAEPRQPGSQPPIAPLLVLVVSAFLSGAHTITDIARWIQGPEARRLREMLVLDEGQLPSMTTLWRILSGTDTAALDEALSDWLGQRGVKQQDVLRTMLSRAESSFTALPCLAVLDAFARSFFTARAQSAEVG
jgi:hypothetical protein